MLCKREVVKLFIILTLAKEEMYGIKVDYG